MIFFLVLYYPVATRFLMFGELIKETQEYFLKSHKYSFSCPEDSLLEITSKTEEEEEVDCGW